MHWMQQGSAEDWSHWENLIKDATLLRVSVEAPDGTIAAIADIGTGLTPRPDRSQFVGMTVVAPHRRKGIARALLEALEEEDPRRTVQKLLECAPACVNLSQDFAIGLADRPDSRR